MRTGQSDERAYAKRRRTSGHPATALFLPPSLSDLGLPRMLSLSQFSYSWCNLLFLLLNCLFFFFSAMVLLFSELLFSLRPATESSVLFRIIILLLFSSFFQTGRYNVNLRLKVQDGSSYSWFLGWRTRKLSLSGTSPSLFCLRASPTISSGVSSQIFYMEAQRSKTECSKRSRKKLHIYYNLVLEFQKVTYYID